MSIEAKIELKMQRLNYMSSKILALFVPEKQLCMFE